MDSDVVAMDMMSHEELTRAISQLHMALACRSSPSTSPPPPRQPPAHAPSDLLCPPFRRPPPPSALHPVRTASSATRQRLLAGDADAAARPRRRQRNVPGVSSERQSVAARLRRERVGQRMRALQRLVPGGARLDTASMLEEAIRYARFLKSHVQALKQLAAAAAAAAMAPPAGVF